METETEQLQLDPERQSMLPSGSNAAKAQLITPEQVTKSN